MFIIRTRSRQGWYLLGGLAILFCIGLSAGAPQGGPRAFAGRFSDTTVGLAQSNSHSPSCPPTSQPVSIDDSGFIPQALTIYPDTTVQWTNTGARIHTTTSNNGTWDSGPLDSGQSFNFAFTVPGTYNYVCTIHGFTGTITVLEGCPPAATDTPTPTITPTSVNTPIPTSTPTITDTPVSGATATPTCPPSVLVQPVSIHDTQFVPDPVTVGLGATVHWTNNGDSGRAHTTTSSTGLWNSGPLDSGQSFDFAFAALGTYTYLCTIHGFTGTIVVVPNCPPTSTPVPPTSTPTPTPTSAGIINGHLTWLSVSPSNRPLVTGTLALCISGSQQTFNFTTDTNGNFTVTTGLPDGIYHWQTKGGRHLSNASPADGGDLAISEGQATQEFGTQKGGDSRSDNVVNTLDFSDLKVRFGQSGNYPADFDYNQTVNILDFGILKNDFGQAGHAITCP